MISSSETTRLLGRFISYPPSLGKIIGIEEAVFLLNILYISNIEDGWIVRDSEKLENETGLARKQQLRVRESLKSQGLLEEKRGRNEVSFRVVEERYDALILSLKKNRQVPNETSRTAQTGLLQVPKRDFSGGVSIIEEEDQKQQQRREEVLPLEREVRRALPKPEKKLKVRGFQKKESVPKAKIPAEWDWWAALYKRYTGHFTINTPQLWELLLALLKELTKEEIEVRLSSWLDVRGERVNEWSGRDFLMGEWKLVEEEGEDEFGRDIPEFKGHIR